MSTNLFQRLRNLLPAPSVLIGTVVSVDSTSGYSTVQFPGAATQTAYAANVEIGSLARVRGTGVEPGKRAFVRAGVIESQAPDGDVIEVAVGRAVQVTST